MIVVSAALMSRRITHLQRFLPESKAFCPITKRIFIMLPDAIRRFVEHRFKNSHKFIIVPTQFIFRLWKSNSANGAAISIGALACLMDSSFQKKCLFSLNCLFCWTGKCKLETKKYSTATRFQMNMTTKYLKFRNAFLCDGLTYQ